MLEVLILHVMVEVVVEVEIIDSIYVDMAVGSGERFPKERVVPLGVGGMGRVYVPETQKILEQRRIKWNMEESDRITKKHIQYV